MGDAEGGGTHRPPTYEEIYSSQLSPLGPSSQGNNHDPERQVLLSHDASELSMGGYQPPSVESPRPSEESGASFTSEATSEASSYARFRREMVEMDVLDTPLNEETANSSRFRTHFNKGLTAITTTLSSFHRRIPVRWPSFRSIFCKIPPTNLAFLSFIGRLFALVMILVTTYFAMSIILPSGRGVGQMFDRESVREFVQGQMDGERIRRFLQHLTSFDHIAGTQGDYIMAKYVETVFDAAQLEDVGLNEYVDPSISSVSQKMHLLIIVILGIRSISITRGLLAGVLLSLILWIWLGKLYWKKVRYTRIKLLTKRRL